MRAFTLVTALLAASLLTVGLVNARQDDDPKPPRKTLADMSAAEQAKARATAMALAVPGPEHELFTGYAGTFDTKTTLWAAPGADPIIVEGEAKHELALGGRYLRTSSTTVYSFPSTGDYEVEALQFLGFDRRRGRYTSVGFDTMGTYSVSAEGSFDAATNSVTLSGVDEDPILGLNAVFDVVIEFVDDDTMKTSMIYRGAFGPEPHKLMEIVSRRRKE